MKRLLFGVALASGLLAALSVEAAQRKSTEASIILNVPSQYASLPVWQPRLGDTVTFTATYPDSLSRYYVWINLLCYQGERHTLVFAVTQQPGASFNLGGTSSPWVQNGGPATCVANLFYWAKGGKYTLLASTDFDVAG